MSSRNKSSINTLISAIHGGLSEGQTTELLRKISEDLDEVFTQVNTGPIPYASLDLQNVPHSAFPSGVVFEDQENTFTERQEFEGDLISIEIFEETGTVKGRIQNTGPSGTLFSGGMIYDGSIYDGDDGTNGIGILLNDTINELNILQMITGSALSVFKIVAGGIVTIGTISNLTSLQQHEMGLRNSKSLRGFNNAGNNNWSLIQLDSNDMVRVGADKASSGAGHLAIPRDTAANLPASGGTRNGLLVIDSDNNRLCFYVNSLRYYIDGVAF